VVADIPEPSVRDVVLFESDRAAVDPRWISHPPIRTRIDLGGGVCIQPLPGELSRFVKSACAFRGHNWRIVMHTLPTPYAFVRDLPDGDRWDADQQLQVAIALSRLCNPTSIGLEFAARVYAPGIRHPTEYLVEPSLIAGHGNQAFIPDSAGRNWLTTEDVVDLPAMIAAFATVPERVRRAAWFHEYASRIEHVPVRFALTVTGIEALVHVERWRSTRQFVSGACGLAKDVGLPFTDADATSAYDQRSRYAHGATVHAAAPALLISVEAVLRAALKRTLLDPEYGAVFAEDARIRERFR
jgi:hypothetical protein